MFSTLIKSYHSGQLVIATDTHTSFDAKLVNKNLINANHRVHVYMLVVVTMFWAI